MIGRAILSHNAASVSLLQFVSILFGEVTYGTVQVEFAVSPHV